MTKNRHDHADRTRRVVESWPSRRNVAENPYQALFSEALESAGWSVHEFSVSSLFRRADVWHWHWPDLQVSRKSRTESLFRAAMLAAFVMWAHSRGTSVVWSVHNVRSHDQQHPRLELRFFRWFTAHLDGVHYLSQANKIEAESAYPSLQSIPSIVIPHGSYPRSGDSGSSVEARKQLGIRPDARVVSFVGRIRAYKGIDQLLAAFEHRRDAELHLVIGGAPEDEVISRISRLSRRDPALRSFLHHLSDSEMSRILTASDVVILPYLTSGNSGTAMLALSSNRPILVPDHPSMLDLRDAIGPRWIRLFHPPLTSAALEGSISDLPIGSPNLDAFEWKTLAHQYSAWYEHIEVRRRGLSRP